MAKGINVIITKGTGSDPVTYEVSRNINGAGWVVIQAALTFTTSPMTYGNQGDFADGDSVQYRARSTNTDGTSTYATIQTHVVSGGGGGGFTNSETQTYIDRLTTLSRPLPSAGQQTKIDTFIGELKAAGVWAKADVISLMMDIGNKESAKVNLFPPASFELTETGSVSWTDADGFASDGSSTQIVLPFNLSSSGTNFTLNNNCMLVYYPQGMATQRYNFGCIVGSPLMRYHSGNGVASGNNCANTGSAAGGLVNNLHGLRRNAATNYDIIGQASPENIVEASVELPDSNVSYTGRVGSTSFLPTDPAGFAYVGAYLNNTEIAAVDTAITNYLT